MKPIHVVQGTQVVLRPMELRYVSERYRQWLCDPEVNKYIAAIHQSLDQINDYVNERIANENIRFWAICDRSTDQHIGNVKLEPISKPLSRATFGILIGERSFWGRGICTEVTRLVSQYAFDVLEIEKVDLGVAESNVAAWSAYKKAGFQVEGCLRKHQLLHGQLVDVLLMANFAER